MWQSWASGEGQKGAFAPPGFWKYLLYIFWLLCPKQFSMRKNNYNYLGNVLERKTPWTTKQEFEGNYLTTERNRVLISTNHGQRPLISVGLGDRVVPKTATASQFLALPLGMPPYCFPTRASLSPLLFRKRLKTALCLTSYVKPGWQRLWWVV